MASRHTTGHHFGLRLQIHFDLEVFLAMLGIKPRMSTALHPQTDRRTERFNQTIEAYLRTFVNKEQSDWCGPPPMAEFAYNKSTTATTGQTPFYANYDRHPETTTPRRTEVVNPASSTYAHWMTSIIKDTKKALEATQGRMAKYADKHRAESPVYQVGDLAMLSSCTIGTRRPS